MWRLAGGGTQPHTAQQSSLLPAPPFTHLHLSTIWRRFSTKSATKGGEIAHDVMTSENGKHWRKRIVAGCELSNFNVIFATLLWLLFVGLDALPVEEMLLDPSKYHFRRNFITGELFYKNLTLLREPEPVRRFRITASIIEAAASDGGFMDVCRVRVRWLEPEQWWDNFQDEQRYYELRCEVENETDGNTHTFVQVNVGSSITGYEEKFLVQQPYDLLMRCTVRSLNGVGLASRWVWTNTVRLSDLFEMHISSKTHRRQRSRGRAYFGNSGGAEWKHKQLDESPSPTRLRRRFLHWEKLSGRNAPKSTPFLKPPIEFS